MIVTRGRLVRQIPIRLLDLSLSGCLLQTTQPIEAGTTGELQVDVQGTCYRGGLFVVRTAPRCGTHASHLAGQFSPATSSSQPPMRRAIQTLASNLVVETRPAAPALPHPV